MAHPRCLESGPCASSVPWQPPCRPVVDTLSVPESALKWQDKELTKEQLVDIALCNNPETRITWAHAKAVAYRLQATKSSLYPSINAAAAYAVTFQNFRGKEGGKGGIVVLSEPFNEENEEESIDPFNQPGPITIGEFVGGRSNTTHLLVSDLSASYLLWDFGGRCARIESARQALHIANWSHNRNIQTVIINVLLAYYAYLDADALLEAQKDDLEDAEMNVEAAKELYQAGVKTHLDVLQVQSQLVNTRLTLEEIRGIAKTELGRLANSLGLPADTSLSVAKLPQEIPMKDTLSDVEKLMETAKKCRPDITLRYAEYKKTQAEQRIAQSDGLPFVTANAGIERVNALSKSAGSGTVYSGSIGVEIPLFQGYYYTNRRRAAKARIATAFADLQSKEADVLLEVWESYYAFKTAVETYKYSEEFLNYTQETYNAAMDSYKEGTGTILDLLSAQVALSRARMQKIQARTLWFTSLAGIAYATGTL